MRKIVLEFLEILINLNRKLRRILLIIVDFFIVLASLILANSNVAINSNLTLLDNLIYFSVCSIFGLLLYIFSGQYKGITRFQGSKFFYKLIYKNLTLSIFSLLIFRLIFQVNLKLSYVIELFIFLNSISLLVRLFLKDILNNIYTSDKKTQKKIAIYGAGNAGAQLEMSLRFSKKYEVICFLDDNQNLTNRYLNSKPIFPRKKLLELKGVVEQVMLAIPSLNSESKKNIINFLTKEKIPTFIIPSIEELSSGKIPINTIRPVLIEDILGRSSVIPDRNLLFKEISDKTICIIGGAGSIGSQLCKEIIQLNPKKLICIDQNELGLYKLEQDLGSKSSHDFEIDYVLINAQNRADLKEVFYKNNINIVFHAAAYKHVPLVEKNPLSGIFNNVWTTKVICEICLEYKVNKFMLISTDKAVRPTNVMGASKRLAELVVQAYSEYSKRRIQNNPINKIETIFSMVRFGNVLDSSGSVVPLFRKQISNGGPITVTHKKVTRYFMTIPEAAQLVIQSISLAEGGEVFLLDMGQPMNIFHLAKQMIILSGLKIKDDAHPLGDIEIKVTGLRPGEKLFEELLIDAKCEKTNHELIYKGVENFCPIEELMPRLSKLHDKILEKNESSVLEQLSELVPEWKRSN